MVSRETPDLNEGKVGRETPDLNEGKVGRETPALNEGKVGWEQLQRELTVAPEMRAWSARPK